MIQDILVSLKEGEQEPAAEKYAISMAAALEAHIGGITLAYDPIELMSQLSCMGGSPRQMAKQPDGSALRFNPVRCLEPQGGRTDGRPERLARRTVAGNEVLHNRSRQLKIGKHHLRFARSKIDIMRFARGRCSGTNRRERRSPYGARRDFHSRPTTGWRARSFPALLSACRLRRWLWLSRIGRCI